MERSQSAVVVFDLGEVLVTPTGLMSRLAQQLGVSEEVFTDAYWSYRDEYDRGGAPNTYWQAVGREVGARLSPAEVKSLAIADVDAWTDIRPDSHEMLIGLRQARVRSAILSNAPRMLKASVKRRPWSQLVERVFVSGELSVAKPDREVFELVTNSLGVAPQEVLFFDDRRVNVDAARRQGWDAIHWISPEQMWTELVDRGMLQATGTPHGRG